MVTIRGVALCIAALASLSHAQPARQAPDLVLVGGKVFTSDTARPWAEAIAIRGERVVAVGTTVEVRRLAGPATRVIDVGGRVVMPGFNDAHDHLAGGNSGTYVSMGGEVANASGAQVLDSIRVVVTRAARGTWIRTEVWTRALDDTALRRPALDRVAPNHPVIIHSGWGHGVIVNTAAMRASGDARERRYGRFDRSSPQQFVARAAVLEADRRMDGGCPPPARCAT